MDQLLDALEIDSPGWRTASRFGIPWCLAILMIALAYAQGRLEAQFQLGPGGSCIWVSCVWVLWTLWHSVLFPAAHARLAGKRPHAYRIAFISHIAPGVTIAFAQMLRPLFNAEVFAHYRALVSMPPTGAVEWTTFGLGNLLCVGAGMLFVWAWGSIGTANVAFVPEYHAFRSFTPLRVGPYGFIRHPLFWAGVYFSVALALFTNTLASYLIALLNAAYGLAYNFLEDRRLIMTFGDSYAAYARDLPPVVPRLVR